MSRRPNEQLFLQRAAYRQRRVRDAAKILPVAGFILWSLPLGWGIARGADDPVGSSSLIYIFGVWVVLIVLAAVFSNLIRAEETTGSEAGEKSGK